MTCIATLTSIEYDTLFFPGKNNVHSTLVVTKSDRAYVPELRSLGQSSLR